MEEANRASGDAISQLLVGTEVLHRMMRALITDPALSPETLRAARESVEAACDHFSQQPDKAAEADVLRRIYTSEIDNAITHRR